MFPHSLDEIILKAGDEVDPYMNDLSQYVTVTFTDLGDPINYYVRFNKGLYKDRMMWIGDKGSIKIL
jgi:hypothetical protein